MSRGEVDGHVRFGRSWYDCDQVVAGLRDPPRTIGTPGFLPIREEITEPYSASTPEAHARSDGGRA